MKLGGHDRSRESDNSNRVSKRIGLDRKRGRCPPPLQITRPITRRGESTLTRISLRLRRAEALRGLHASPSFSPSRKWASFCSQLADSRAFFSRATSEYACYSGRVSRETLEARDSRGTKSLGIITAGRKIPGKCRARCPAAGLTDGKRDFHPGTRRLRRNASFFAPSGELSMHEACRVINLSHAITGSDAIREK